MQLYADENLSVYKNCNKASFSIFSAGLLASVPTIQEEAEPPMSDDSQASSSTNGETRQSSIILTGFTVQLSVFLAMLCFYL